MNTRKHLNKGIAQAGSMMIEAMAMLALISLVTPTLYKKSAERTTELQDINTATHLRTLIKAVDNYVADNYDEKMSSMAEAGGIDQLDDLSLLANYLPYGYNLDSAIKNFGQPKISIRRNGAGITSYIELPKKDGIETVRASRIASMVGSNGGYVNPEGNVDGVGGSWGLTKDDFNSLFSNGNKDMDNSIVVTSLEAVTSATSNALENDKYLQRTKVGNENQRWRNAMSTDLYMGGLKNQSADATGNTDDTYSIYGVNRLILGDTNETTGRSEDLVVTKNGINGDEEGSAYIGGIFSAVDEAFQVLGEKDDPRLLFGTTTDKGDILNADNESVTVFGDTNGLIIDNNGTIDTDYKTTVNNELYSNDSTYLVTDGGTFKVGNDGKYITATADQVNLRDGQVVLDADKAVVKGKTHFNTGESFVKVGGTDETLAIPDKDTTLKPKFEVIGDAYVSDTLYAGKIETPDFDTLELHAGGKEFGDTSKRWLHATYDNGVIVRDPDNANAVALEINDSHTKLSDLEGTATLKLSDDKSGNGVAALGASKTVTLNTNSGGNVLIQENSDGSSARLIVREGESDATSYVKVSENTPFIVAKNSANTLYQVNPGNEGTLSSVTNNAYETVVRPGGVDTDSTDANFSVMSKDDKTALAVRPNRNDGLGVSYDANVTLDQSSFRVTDTDNEKRVFLVNMNSKDTTHEDYTTNSTTKTPKASVYIRNGAIEVSPTLVSVDRDSVGAVGENSYGYIEASRFVANNIDGTTTVAPVYAEDTTVPWEGVNPDRYMVNPAYTSVMHDIKLTTRGGARLSDILPDFINKGIYVVTNSYKDTGADPTTMSGGTEATDNETWASAYLGTVPAPQCPPGHARVITITPAGFMMAQAGDLYRGEDDTRWYVNSTLNYHLTNLNLPSPSPTGEATKSTPVGWNSATLDENTTGYFLGYKDTDINGVVNVPTPLFFQQSTWLKSKIVAQDTSGKCNEGSSSNNCDSATFIGWNALMGFIYPDGWYSNIIDQIKGTNNIGGSFEVGDNTSSSASNLVYWNIFPVKANTLEAYATVYCYFDRNNLYGSGNVSKYTEQYDRLSSNSTGHDKENNGDNTEYLQRLNDPTLSYTSQW